MLPTNNFTLYKEFFWNLAAVFAINTLVNGTVTVVLWPFSFMLLFVLATSGKYGRIDLTTTNTLARIFVEGDEYNLIDLCWTILAQFLGALVGGILYCGITDKTALINCDVPKSSDRWRPFLCFTFFHAFYYVVVAAYKKNKASSLERNLGTAFAYASICIMFQAFATNAFGGFNIDAGRLFASKMIHDKESQDYLKDNWWILFLGPFAGLALAKGLVLLEGLVGGDEEPKSADDEAGNEA